MCHYTVCSLYEVRDVVLTTLQGLPLLDMLQTSSPSMTTDCSEGQRNSLHSVDRNQWKYWLWHRAPIGNVCGITLPLLSSLYSGSSAESTDPIFDNNAIFHNLVHLGSHTIEWSEANQNSYGLYLFQSPYTTENPSYLSVGADCSLEWLHDPDSLAPVILLEDIAILIKVCNPLQDSLSSYQMSWQLS